MSWVPRAPASSLEMMLAGPGLQRMASLRQERTFQGREEDHDESHQRMAAAVLVGGGADRAPLEMMPAAPPARKLHSFVSSEKTAAHRPVQPPGDHLPQGPRAPQSRIP